MERVGIWNNNIYRRLLVGDSGVNEGQRELACSQWERPVEGSVPQQPPVETHRPRSRSIKWGLESNTACYGQEKKFWVNIAICFCLPPSVWRCPWSSRYRRRKWTRRHEFKSWTRLIAFHIALIPLGKVSIQLFSLQLWVNSRTD